MKKQYAQCLNDRDKNGMNEKNERSRQIKNKNYSDKLQYLFKFISHFLVCVISLKVQDFLKRNLFFRMCMCVCAHSLLFS